MCTKISVFYKGHILQTLTELQPKTENQTGKCFQKILKKAKSKKFVIVKWPFLKSISHKKLFSIFLETRRFGPLWGPNF